MASDTKRLTQSEAIEIARKAMDNQERLREKLALSEAVVRDGCEMHTEALDSLTAEVERLTRELDAERHHRINLDVIAKNLTVKCDQQTRALETSRRSVDDWREAWEQKQIELERAEAERDAALARIAALEWSLGVSEEERVAMVGASGRLRDRVAALERVARASQGIIHEGLHGGRPTDPEHQELCEMPACRRIRAALAAAAPGEGEGA